MSLELLCWLWLGAIALGCLFSFVIALNDKLWNFRQFSGGVLTAWFVAAFPLIFATNYPNWLKAVLVVANLYFIVDSVRWWRGKHQQNYLRFSNMKSTAWIALVITIAILASWLAEFISLQEVVLSVSLAIALLTFAQLIWGLKHYRVGKFKQVFNEDKLPTVTLAIPARNETHALEDALNKAIKSDYPKLEIIVLDDCSQDSTANLIKSFAHDGVRFVQGSQPASGWLGKNYASEVLAEEASGEIIIFAGVDTHFDPKSISQIISYMLTKKAKMVSILPRRREFDLLPTFFEQLRNYWQIVLPLAKKRLPFASACWAIYAKTLKTAGGFDSFKGSVFPEAHMARFTKQTNSYRFLVSNNDIGVTTRKHLKSQIETATRTFYPIASRHPSTILIFSLMLLTFYILPYFVLISDVINQQLTLAGTLALIVVILFTLTHILILKRTNPHGWMVGFINFPILIIFDVILFNWSMLAFEFGEVNWKGRNVCYPVLKAIPKNEFQKQLDS